MKRPKAGIICFHSTENYGGVLLSYGEQRLLSKWGYETEILDFRHPSFSRTKLWQGWGFSQGVSLRQVERRVLSLVNAAALESVFERFRISKIRRSALLKTVEDFKDYVSSFDVLVTGSDQVWHLGHPLQYFLPTHPGSRAKKVALACCSGSINQPGLKLDSVKEKVALIRDFDYVSVRNDFTADIVEEATGGRVDVLCDPSLLSDYTDLNDSSRVPNEPYIFYYSLAAGREETSRRVLDSLRKRMGLNLAVSVISSSRNPRRSVGEDIRFLDADPSDWVALLAGASFVLTDSYHGVLFSLKFKRNFLGTYDDSFRASRLIDLITRYELGNRIVPLDEAEKHVSEKWDKVTKPLDLSKLNSHIDSSREILEGVFIH